MGRSEAGFNASVVSVDDCCDNGLAETLSGLVNSGLDKAEVIRKNGRWKVSGEVGLAVLNCVEWLNFHRLVDSAGDMLPRYFALRYFLCTTLLPLHNVTIN